MELMLGETLRKRFDASGSWPRGGGVRSSPGWPARWTTRTRRGIIRRDVKPQNVFVSDEGVKLGDFGNARVVSLASVTGASLTWGTPEYVAPEVFTRGRADPRSDLYRWAPLFEMLTGGSRGRGARR